MRIKRTCIFDIGDKLEWTTGKYDGYGKDAPRIIRIIEFPYGQDSYTTDMTEELLNEEKRNDGAFDEYWQTLTDAYGSWIANVYEERDSSPTWGHEVSGEGQHRGSDYSRSSGKVRESEEVLADGELKEPGAIDGGVQRSVWREPASKKTVSFSRFTAPFLSRLPWTYDILPVSQCCLPTYSWTLATYGFSDGGAVLLLLYRRF